MKIRLALLATLLIFPTLRAEAMLEDSFLYFPDRTLVATPAAAGLAYRDVYFAAADGVRLHGWYLAGQADRPVVLYSHGNAGNISHRIEALAGFQRLGLNVLAYDYRGYGRSAGAPSEAGTYRDAHGALAWLEAQGWAPRRIIYFGRSLGAAVALQLALDRPPAALVMETPFTSIAAMGRRHYPLLSRALGWLLDLEYDNAGKLPGLRSRLLITQGTEDRIVPPGMAERLFELAPQPKRLVMIEGAGHNDSFFRSAVYRQAWQTLLAEIVPQDDAQAPD